MLMWKRRKYDSGFLCQDDKGYTFQKGMKKRICYSALKRQGKKAQGICKGGMTESRQEVSVGVAA